MRPRAGSRARRTVVGAALSLLLVGPLLAQSSPPGLGRAHTAFWCALGFRQQLDTLRRKQWTGYVGLGRKSDPDDYRPLHRPAIIVVDQAFTHRFHRHWQYSLAVSYRQQDEYAAGAPFDHAEPGMRREFRGYGRFTFLMGRHRLKLAATLRQEVRLFYAPDLTPWEEDLELRTRFRLQGTWVLNTKGTTRLVVSGEPLFAAGREHEPGHPWVPVHYTESRFCCFLTTHPTPLPLEVGLGYMNDLVAPASPRDVHYVALSVVWEDPFGRAG